MTYKTENKSKISKKEDVVYTNEIYAKIIINEFKPQGKILDPCAGKNNVFYNNFPKNSEKYRCEIEDNIDFFDFNNKVDQIISNPPYSIFNQFLLKSFEVSDNVVFLIPLTKVFKNMKIETAIKKYGGIKTILHMGTGGKIGFPFGFPTGCVHYQKNYRGTINYETIYEYF